MASMGTSRPHSGACLCRRCTRPRPGETPRPRQSGRVTHREITPDSASAAPAMWTTTTLLPRNVDDFRQIDNGKVQEREGCSHGAQTWSLRLPRTRRLSRYLCNFFTLNWLQVFLIATTCGQNAL